MDDDVSSDGELEAGEFGSWLTRMREALAGRAESDVPCDGCTACCSSSQFVHIEPDETDALAHIPAELLFPTPGMPEGHVLMGYDERGRCPMLGDAGCSIYAHRPRACRVYDCRVFAAAGVEINEPSKAAVAQRSARWRFEHGSDEAWIRHEATRAAAAYVAANHAELPGGDGPPSATLRAITAIDLADLFVGSDPATGAAVVAEPLRAAVVAALEARRRN